MTSAPSPALEAARALLRARFGYPDFRPAQVGALEAVLGGQDALIVLPTGGGKSLCYQVPALLRDGLTLVLSPLISLMKDQVEALERRGLPAAYINSTLSSGEVADRIAEVEAGRVRLLYLAPERVEGGRLLRRLQEVGVTMLAVDEAHCISEWGHDFRPSYRRIGTMRDQLGGPQTVALTATATPDVREDIVRQLALRSPRVVVAGFDRTNLTYHVAPTRTQQAKDEAAVAWLREAEGPAIVYAPTRKAVERVAGALNRRRLRSVAYHAGLDDASRQRAQDAFMREQVRVMVATSAFGMGIDKADVRLVVHHAMPGSLEAYYQEAGRAGRDGHPSTCVLLHSYPDRFTHEFFIGAAHPERRVVEQLWRLLAARADASGLVTDRLEELVSALPRELGARKVEAALRLLQGAGVCTPEAPAPGRVWVRLLAAPARITRELSGARELDRELLRALWRIAGRRLETGVSLDLDGLPPVFGGSSAVIPMLERLEGGQFVTWYRQGGGWRLPAKRPPEVRVPVDWAALERRRQADLHRLDAMQGYAQTRYCRRAYLLRYFGDPAAREACAGCDRCLGAAADPERGTRPRRHPVRA
ncbi:MAG: ATP-dependent helicase RecQ [Gemmatimonadota bacterium]|jgi:ATP-dependent DNA helicase RecQ